MLKTTTIRTFNKVTRELESKLGAIKDCLPVWPARTDVAAG